MRKIAYIIIGACFFLVQNPVYAQFRFDDSAQAFQISGLSTILTVILKTLQFYTLPIMVIALAALGVKLLLSQDDVAMKNQLKSWITRVFIAGTIIFGASTIGMQLQNLIVSNVK